MISAFRNWDLFIVYYINLLKCYMVLSRIITFCYTSSYIHYIRIVSYVIKILYVSIYLSVSERIVLSHYYFGFVCILWISTLHNSKQKFITVSLLVDCFLNKIECSSLFHLIFFFMTSILLYFNIAIFVRIVSNL